MINKMILTAVLIGSLAVPMSTSGEETITECYYDDWMNKVCNERTITPEEREITRRENQTPDERAKERRERQRVRQECVGDPKGYWHCTQYGPTVQYDISPTLPGTDFPDLNRPGYHVEGDIIYPTVPRGASRDYSRPGWIRKGNVYYPTYPGTDERDYRRPGFRIDR